VPKKGPERAPGWIREGPKGSPKKRRNTKKGKRRKERKRKKEKQKRRVFFRWAPRGVQEGSKRGREESLRVLMRTQRGPK
jgi:hypothetical protein